jgi:lipoate-protein ligase A
MTRAMTALRIVDTGVKPACWNIAATAALVELHRIGSTPDTIRFHRYPRSVLIGRHQVLTQQVDVERCRRDGVEIARRVTGGGAVYMSPSILAWDIVAGRYCFGGSLEEVSMRISSAFAAGLQRLDCPAEASAQGGIEIGGRKVSGSSGGFDGPTMIMQGTMLIDFDRVEMTALLRALPEAAKPVIRVASLADCLGRAPPIEDVRAALLAELYNASHGATVMTDMRADELALAERLLADEIGTEEFVTGRVGDPAQAPGSGAQRRRANA